MVSQNANFNVSTSNDEEIDDTLMIIPSESTHFYDSYHQQHFSFRNSFMSYIIKNPSSPKQYQKIIKVCKYFFIKNQILVIPQFRYFHFNINEYEICFNDKQINFNNISSKFWITDKMEISKHIDAESTAYFTSCIVPKIYRSDIKYFYLDKENILFKDFIFLASKIEKIFFSWGYVKNDDGTVATLENVIKICSNLLYVDWILENAPTKTITSKTVQELIKTHQFLNLKKFELHNIPQIFDIECFHRFLKENKKTDILLYFSNEISEEYKIRLQAVVDEIIEKEHFDYKVPIIYFSGIKDGSFQELNDLRDMSFSEC